MASKTKTAVLRENGRGGGSVQIVNDDEMPVSLAIAAGETGVYRDLMGQWYGYLSEAEDKLE